MTPQTHETPQVTAVPDLRSAAGPPVADGLETGTAIDEETAPRRAAQEHAGAPAAASGATAGATATSTRATASAPAPSAPAAAAGAASAAAVPAGAAAEGASPGCPPSQSGPARGLAQGWCALSALHGRIESHIERALQAGHDLSVREFSVLNVLSEQHDGPGGHLRMNQVADSVVLSQSATTRLVTRLEERGLLSRYLCPDDRRGIYTNVTADGLALLEKARPAHDNALREALQEAARRPELAPLVTAVETLAPSI